MTNLRTLAITPKPKLSFHSVRLPNLSETEESINESKQCEYTVESFLQLHGRCLSYVCSTWSDTKEYYCDMLQCVQDTVHRKRMYVAGKWQLHHDNIPSPSEQALASGFWPSTTFHKSKNHNIS